MNKKDTLTGSLDALSTDDSVSTDERLIANGSEGDNQSEDSFLDHCDPPDDKQKDQTLTEVKLNLFFHNFSYSFRLALIKSHLIVCINLQ